MKFQENSKRSTEIQQMMHIVRRHSYYDSEMNEQFIELRIQRVDISFLRTALEERLRVWENTLEYEQAGKSIGETEECSSVYEAEQMVLLWREFMASIEKQITSALQ